MALEIMELFTTGPGTTAFFIVVVIAGIARVHIRILAVAIDTGVA